LYEVVLSLAILLGALTVLGELIATGSRAAIRARMQTQATLFCQSKLSEIVAGAEPMQSVEGVPLDNSQPEWIWGLQVLPGPHESLLEIEVTVSHITLGDRVDTKVSINRYIRDPQLFEQAAAQEVPAEDSAEE
jgi:type II secretory pathway pseudopilin PulG